MTPRIENVDSATTAQNIWSICQGREEGGELWSWINDDNEQIHIPCVHKKIIFYVVYTPNLDWVWLVTQAKIT